MDDDLVMMRELAAVILGRVERPAPHRRGFVLTVFEEGSDAVYTTYHGPKGPMTRALTSALAGAISTDTEIDAFRVSLPS